MRISHLDYKPGRVSQPGDMAIIFMCEAYKFHGGSKIGHTTLVIIRGTLESAEEGFASH
jgi:hypothetical protein